MPARTGAAAVHDALVRVARGQGALDLAVGEGTTRLFFASRLMALGYSTERDYARERLGLPPRTVQNALALARACTGRPLLRKAVVAGLVSPCKARAIAPVVGGNEPGWTALAMTSTVRELETAVRAAGKEPPAELESESLRLKMTPAQQDVLDRALELADQVEGGGTPRWQRYEALAQEWLCEHGHWAPDEEGVRGPEGGDISAKPLPKDVAEHLAVIEEARALVEDRAPETTDPKELEAFVMRVLRARKRTDLVFGPLALRVVTERIWAAVGCATLKEYVTERLGMSLSLFRQRVWLERQMLALPALKEALEAGVLTYSKALLVAQDATPEDVAERIAAAAETTWEQTDRETTAREDKRNRARGIRRLWAPMEVMRLVTLAILSAQRRAEGEGRRIGAGEALLEIALHFESVWSWLRGKPIPKARQQVLNRNGGTCEVPGCSLPGRHVHHIRYRSQGGAEAPWNETLLCIPHHLRGVHMGHLEVEGRAGERLIWRFGNGEIWVTEGDDDVRCAHGAEGADRVSEGPSPGYGRGARVGGTPRVPAEAAA